MVIDYLFRVAHAAVTDLDGVYKQQFSNLTISVICKQTTISVICKQTTIQLHLFRRVLSIHQPRPPKQSTRLRLQL